MPRPRFLGRPTRGGWLTITNCLCLAAIFLAVRTFDVLPQDGPVVAVVATVFIALLSPAAILFWLPSLGHPSGNQIILQAVMAGVNAVVWGYGISWVIGLIRRFDHGEVTDKTFFEW